MEEQKKVDLSKLSAEELDLLKVEAEKRLKVAQHTLYTVELQELELAKQIVDLQSKRKDLQIAISKAKHIVRQLVLDVRILTSYFWRARG